MINVVNKEGEEEGTATTVATATLAEVATVIVIVTAAIAVMAAVRNAPIASRERVNAWETAAGNVGISATTVTSNVIATVVAVIVEGATAKLPTGTSKVTLVYKESIVRF